jgi:ubiquitin-conjugating enzyme E2 I
MRLVPPIYHPNVFSSGAICLSILNADWRPSVTLNDIMISIQHLLSHPNADHVTDRPEVSEMYKKNPAQYSRKIRQQTIDFKSREALEAQPDFSETNLSGKKRPATDP